MRRSIMVGTALAVLLAAGACRDAAVDCGELPVKEVVVGRQGGGLAALVRLATDRGATSSYADRDDGAVAFGRLQAQMELALRHPKCFDEALPKAWAFDELRGLAQAVVEPLDPDVRAQYLAAAPDVRRLIEGGGDAIAVEEFRRLAHYLFDERYWTDSDPRMELRTVTMAGEIEVLWTDEPAQQRARSLPRLHTMRQEGEALVTGAE